MTRARPRQALSEAVPRRCVAPDRPREDVYGALVECVFCQIVEGRAAAWRVYQDDGLRHVWDARPASRDDLDELEARITGTVR